MRSLLLSIALVTLSVQAQEDVILDVPGLAGKTKTEVAAIIGEPLSCSQYKGDREDCQYKKAKTTIAFFNGKADWFTISNLKGTPFTDDAMSALGYTSLGKPSWENPFQKRWEDRNEFKNAYLFGDKDGSESAVIHVYTKTGRTRR